MTAPLCGGYFKREEKQYNEMRHPVPKIENDSGATSRHYLGRSGEDYSLWQRSLSRGMGAILARKFHSFADESKVTLDFGCGDAGILSALPAKLRIAIEPNPASRAMHDPELVTSLPALSSVDTESIDLLISNHALEHCLNPLADLGEIRRVMKPGARFVLIVPIDDWRVQKKYDPHDVNHHLFTWTPRLLGNLLKEAGFNVESVRINRHAWPPGVVHFARLPAPLFDFVCRFWSRVSHFPEIIAVSIK